MNRITKVILPLLLAAALLLGGCSNIFGANGTLSVSADDVKSIEVISGQSGKQFTVMDRDDIRTIVKHINGYTLDAGSDRKDHYSYCLTLLDADGSASLSFDILDAEAVQTGESSYYVDARKLLLYVEALECRTMTDEELMRTLFEGNYMNRLNITNEDGSISLDKITKLKDNCPALFELLGRPTMLKSIGSYGLDMLREYLSSEDAGLRQQAEKVSEIFKNLIPGLKDQLANILENSKK